MTRGQRPRAGKAAAPRRKKLLPLAAKNRHVYWVIVAAPTAPKRRLARPPAGQKHASGFFWAKRQKRVRKPRAKSLNTRQVARPVTTKTASGVLFYGYRYYSPSLGRFINRDPIEEQGGINLYSFVGNNSINAWDYLGMLILDQTTLDAIYNATWWLDEGIDGNAIDAGRNAVWSSMQGVAPTGSTQSEVDSFTASSNASAAATWAAYQSGIAEWSALSIGPKGDNGFSYTGSIESGGLTISDSSGTIRVQLAQDQENGEWRDFANSFDGVVLGTSTTSNTGQNLAAGAIAIPLPGVLGGGGQTIAAGARAGVLGAALTALMTIPGDQSVASREAASGKRTGATAYRVWGGASGPLGQSWTPIDPRVAPEDYRDLAGLPNTNTGEYLVIGILVDLKGVVLVPASPMPQGTGGTTGGWPELVVPRPGDQIQIINGKIELAPPINTVATGELPK